MDHLSPAQQRAFVLADNKLGEMAGWDKNTLQAEFAELRELDLDFELDLTGFSEAQIDALIVSGEGSDDRKGDQVPVVAHSPVSRLGDLWLLGKHKLICADATDPAVLEQLLAGEQVRTVFTDPPYNVRVGGHVTSNARHGEFVMASGEMSDEAFMAFLGKVWKNIEGR